MIFYMDSDKFRLVGLLYKGGEFLFVFEKIKVGHFLYTST